MDGGLQLPEPDAAAALAKFEAFLDENPDIGTAWAQDAGDTLIRAMKKRFAATKRGREQQPLRTFAKWVEVQPNPLDVLPEDHAVFRWADSVGLPEYYVFLGWCWFRRKYGPGGASENDKYRDWLRHFKTTVQERWGRLWYPHGDGFKLSADGEILSREFPDEARK